MRKFALGCALAAQLLVPVQAIAGAKDFALQGYALPADKPVTIVLMRPDVAVGELQAGGLPQPNAEWTEAARANIAAALKAELGARSIAFVDMETQKATYLERTRAAAADKCALEQSSLSPDDAAARETQIRVCAQKASEQMIDADKLVAEYNALHKAVVGSILAHKYGLGAGKLPTHKAAFNYTLGPGTGRLGEVAGANYGIFLMTNDQFASGGRKAMQVMGALGCLIGACMIVSGGTHVAYASLVELETGNIVWFNLQRGSEGDVREADGAKEMIAAITAPMPTKPGQRTANSDDGSK